MGIGPAVAIPAAVKSAGLELEDVDLFEINEVQITNFILKSECFFDTSFSADLNIQQLQIEK